MTTTLRSSRTRTTVPSRMSRTIGSSASERAFQASQSPFTLRVTQCDQVKQLVDHAVQAHTTRALCRTRRWSAARCRTGSASGGFGCFPDKVAAAKNTGDFVPDDFEHEIATNFVVKGKGLVILTSCSHRGVLNTIRQAQVASGVQKVHAVIGGFHIVPPLTEDYIREVVAELKQIDPDYIMPAHCSGEQFYDITRSALPNKVIHSAATAQGRRATPGSSIPSCRRPAERAAPAARRSRSARTCPSAFASGCHADGRPRRRRSRCHRRPSPAAHSAGAPAPAASSPSISSSMKDRTRSRTARSIGSNQLSKRSVMPSAMSRALSSLHKGWCA